MNICIVIPAAATSTLPTASRPRELHQIDELADALASGGKNRVTVVEGDVTAAPIDGWIIAFGVPRGVGPQIAARTLAIDEDRSTVMRTVEEWGLAGAVEKQRYFEWRAKRADERGFGLVGRRDVASTMGARVLSGPFSSARYAALASASSHDLVSLILEYLVALSEAS